ncbi:MAG: adenylosuccinate synthase [Proteobacteria bacterium]|nr:adenylosuccinate synthase [Pseudomonadota bacterium]
MTSNNHQVSVVVGAQWGDEGKGKWVDVLAKKSQIVARFQGGNNAGHTLWIEGTKYVLHQIPSGIFQKGLISAMAGGVVVHPVGLVGEIEKMRGVVAITPENLWISARSHVITPWHIHLDGVREEKSSSPIGTTKRGIGPTYSDKASRSGIRMGTYIDPHRRKEWMDTMAAANFDFAIHVKTHPTVWQEFQNAAEKIAPFCCDAETRIRAAIREGKNVLLEGAQGTLLDIDHGTYPFVTSSNTAAAGACTSIGLPPHKINAVYGIAKAYVTRVGSGPFPTELLDDVGALIAKKGNEFGATTGRPRRCGWFDAVAFRYSADINGYAGVIINKMDILTGIPTLKICTHYTHPTLGTIKEFPWDWKILENVTPHYESFPGWEEDISKMKHARDLPKNAIQFLRAIEEATGTKIKWVGTGPGREDMLEADF